MKSTINRITMLSLLSLGMLYGTASEANTSQSNMPSSRRMQSSLRTPPKPTVKKDKRASSDEKSYLQKLRENIRLRDKRLSK